MLELDCVNKYFEKNHIVKNASIKVREGEFISLLGPSGCGKTTTLRMIAGFEEVTDGKIILNNQEITNLPPFERDTGMVFQNYALFPHMTVQQNISFGLRMRNKGGKEILIKTQNVLKLIRLERYGDRMPHQLSGGQQQRVALARALAIEPSILLLDEPLSNLDAILREEMQIEIKQIQKHLGITSIFVTHDQIEALALSDRIFLMDDGEIVESGTPKDVYYNPGSKFAANFIGKSNLIKGNVIDIIDKSLLIKSSDDITFKCSNKNDFKINDYVSVFIRLENIKFSIDTENYISNVNRLSVKVKMVSFLGPTIEYICSIGGREIKISRPNEGILSTIEVNQVVDIEWQITDCIVIKN